MFKLSNTAKRVLEKRYLRGTEDTAEDMFKRVAKEVSEAMCNSESWKAEFEQLMLSGKFIPGSPFLVNAGANNSFFSCFVLPVEDDLDSIFTTLKHAAIIQNHYGGVGIDFSKIRPRGSSLSSNPKGGAAGPVAFMRLFHELCNVIKQGGNRSGALMGCLRVDHPDIEEFIACKQVDGELSNFNISVAITDKFMKAVKEDDTVFLNHPKWKMKFSKMKFSNWQNVDRLPKARDIFVKICEAAHKTGDPGILFIDEINRHNPTPDQGPIATTNPCVAGTTRIFLESGPTACIEVLNGKRLNVLVDSRTASKRDRYTSTPMEMTSPAEQCFEMITESGRNIQATAYHKFWVHNPTGGEKYFQKELREIEIGDEILLYNPGDSIKGFGKDGCEGLAWVLGMLYGNEERFVATKGRDEERCIYIDGRKSGRKRDKMERKLIIHTLKMMDEALDYMAKKGLCVKNTDLKNIIYRKGSNRQFWSKELYGAIFNNVDYFAYDELSNWIRNCSFKSFKSFMQSLYIHNKDSGFDGQYITFSFFDSEVAFDIQMKLQGAGILSKVIDNLAMIQIDAIDYAEKIGFWKNDRMKCVIKKRLKNFHPFDYLDPVKEIMPWVDKPVYCVNQPVGNSVVFNGFATGNCGESPLLPYESCCLGSMNVSRSFNQDDVATALQFLDAAIDINNYPLDEIKEVSQRNRKIGLGVMGFAHRLFERGIPYDSNDCLTQIRAIASTIKAGIDKYEEVNPYCEVQNKTYTSIAPTGTISIIAGTSGGIEPVFSLVQKRTILEGEEFYEVDPVFKAWLEKENIYSEELIQKIADNNGSCQGIDEIPVDIQGIYKIASDIDPRWHVTVQAEWQKYIDLGVSKTINLPSEASVDDIADVYKLAFELKCKGVTVYRDGCRANQVLQKGTVKKPLKAVDGVYHTPGVSIPRTDPFFKAFQQSGKALKYEPTQSIQVTSDYPAPKDWHRNHPKRPKRLCGETYCVRTGEGKIYITINYKDKKPVEVFVSPNAKSKQSAIDAECIGRLISVMLRYGVPVEAIVDQCEKVRNQSMLSFPQHIAKLLKNGWNGKWMVMDESSIINPEAYEKLFSEAQDMQSDAKVREALKCPECDNYLHFEEGCCKCTSCGYSMCGG